MALRQLGVGSVYVLLTLLSVLYVPPEGIVSLFHPANGWGLAMMLIGGCQYALGVFVGSLVAHTLLDHPLLLALGISTAQTAGLVAACLLLKRDPVFDPRLQTMQQYRRLLFKGILPVSLITALLATPWLAHAGLLPLGQPAKDIALWMMGESLGMLLLTPMVLLWSQNPLRLDRDKRWIEAVLVLALIGLAGQSIFLERFPDVLLEPSSKGYWLFPLMAWAAARLGRRAVLLGLCVLAIQTALGVNQNIGFFSHPAPLARWMDGWSYMVVLSVLSVSLATTLREMRQASSELRIAATAFDCQEGMIITDADGRILRTNRSFTRIMGYTEAEVLGQLTTFMRSDRHPASFYENGWRTAREQGLWADETWHRRKNGEVFPQWLTATAVKDADGNITNFVVTHTDITYRKQKETEFRASQIAQRNALVREIHHRIKNNLQGITGLLRRFAQSHPEISAPLHEAISQVRSIAIIHGLQGGSPEPSVRLCELLDAIAADIGTLWKTDIRVAIPDLWKPCRIAEAEAVPLALILNELIINAVKHGTPGGPGVRISLRKDGSEDRIEVRISNEGRWAAPELPAGDADRNGLQLVKALLPHSGAQLQHLEEDGMIHVLLRIEPPVIKLDTDSPGHDTLLDAQSTALAG